VGGRDQLRIVAESVGLLDSKLQLHDINFLHG
jgi:hypothetical protein